MNIETLNKVSTLVKKEEFGEEIKDISTAAEFVEAFAAHGIEVTEEEVVEICEALVAGANADELSESELDCVSGGFVQGVLILGGAYIACYVAGRIIGKKIKKSTGVCMK